MFNFTFENFVYLKLYFIESEQHPLLFACSKVKFSNDQAHIIMFIRSFVADEKKKGQLILATLALSISNQTTIIFEYLNTVISFVISCINICWSLSKMFEGHGKC